MPNKLENIETFSALVESAYAAALEPSEWQEFLRGCAEALDAKSGLFRVIDERAPAVRTNVHHNLDPELQEAHRRYYITCDAYVQALRDKPGVFMAPGEAILDPKALQRTEFYSDYLAPQESHHICGGLAMRNEEFTIMFGVQRNARAGPFSEHDAAFLRRLVPHLRRSTRLGHLLVLADQQTTTAEQALESLSVGVLLLDEQDRILHTNSQAAEMLRGPCGLTQSACQPAAAHPADAARLRDLLAAVRSRARFGGPPIPEAVRLTPATGEPQLLVVACPVPPAHTHFQGPWPRATSALFVSNLAEAGLLNHEVLTKLYGLTATEAQLAGELSRGASLAALADEWHVSRETLRTHLKRILAKTGTNRQAELVRLLTGAPWNLVPGQDFGEANRL